MMNKKSDLAFNFISHLTTIGLSIWIMTDVKGFYGIMGWVMVVFLMFRIILTEDYLPQGLMTDCLEQFHCKLPITLKDNQYFGMGDNRTASLDSRYFGVIPRSDIVGRAWVRLWPFSHFRVFKEITYPS